MNSEKENIHLIQEIFKGSGKYYNLHYKEFENKKENCIEIIAEMKIDLNSKAAINKINKSWKKDKSPLLTELQEIYRNHQIDKREGKMGNTYKEIIK